MIAVRLRPIICLLLPILALSPLAAAFKLDGVVATVDREVVLYSEVLRDAQGDLAEARRSARSKAGYERQSDRILEATLNQAIEGKILYREALLLGIEITDEQVEDRIQSLRDLYPTHEAFMQELELAGESMREFRERTRKRLMGQTMSGAKARQLASDAVVSEQDIQAYYEANADAFSRPERVRVRQIFLRAKTSDEAKRQAVRARLELIQEELAAAADFSELAKRYSEAPGAADGGIIGWQQRDDLIPALEGAAFALKAGEVSGIVASPGGLHLLKVDQHEQAGLAPLDEVRTEIEPKVRAAMAEEVYVKWIGELRKRSRVRVFL